MFATTLFVSVMLLWFAILPTHPTRDHVATEAYLNYIKAPTEENHRTFVDIVDRINRRFHVSQYICGAIGLASLIWLFAGLRKHKTTSRDSDFQRLEIG